MRNQKEEWNFLVNTTVEVLKIDREEAIKRVDALYETGILNLNPHDPYTIKMIDLFLAVPSSKHKNFKQQTNATNRNINKGSSLERHDGAVPKGN